MSVYICRQYQGHIPLKSFLHNSVVSLLFWRGLQNHHNRHVTTNWWPTTTGQKWWGAYSHSTSATSCGRIRWVTCSLLFLSGPHLILIKKFIKPKVEYPFSWVAQRTPKTPSGLFRAEGPQSTDSADCGPTRHVNQFHHVILQCWPNFGPLTFFGSTNVAVRSNFCQLPQLLFRVWVSVSLILHAKSWSIVSDCTPLRLKALTKWESSTHQARKI